MARQILTITLYGQFTKKLINTYLQAGKLKYLTFHEHYYRFKLEK